ncbi:MAG: hypothetical protein ACM3XM_00760 [Mycobacterium leprae]
MTKVFKWVLIVAGSLGILLGLLAWLGGSDFWTFLEMAFFGVLLIFTGRGLGKPKKPGEQDEPNDWGSALDRD